MSPQSQTLTSNNGHSRELNGVRTYRGRKLDDLIPQIRDELGPDAIILRQREGLGPSHATNANRHQPSRHLVVRDLPAEVPGQQKFDLFARVLAAVPLAADHL